MRYLAAVLLTAGSLAQAADPPPAINGVALADGMVVILDNNGTFQVTYPLQDGFVVGTLIHEDDWLVYYATQPATVAGTSPNQYYLLDWTPVPTVFLGDSVLRIDIYHNSGLWETIDYAINIVAPPGFSPKNKKPGTIQPAVDQPAVQIWSGLSLDAQRRRAIFGRRRFWQCGPSIIVPAEVPPLSLGNRPEADFTPSADGLPADGVYLTALGGSGKKPNGPPSVKDGNNIELHDGDSVTITGGKMDVKLDATKPHYFTCYLLKMKDNNTIETIFQPDVCFSKPATSKIVKRDPNDKTYQLQPPVVHFKGVNLKQGDQLTLVTHHSRQDPGDFRVAMKLKVK